jgi:hypothetical protein
MKLGKLRPVSRLYVASVLLIHLLVVWNARDLILKGYPDFTIYYTAGTIVRQGMGHTLYDNGVQFQVQRAFAPQVATRLGALPFNHPPFEAVLFVPFAYFPYRLAYLLWGLVNLAMLTALPILLRPHVPVLRDWPAPAWTVTAVSLAFFPIFFALLQGQDAILLLFLYSLVFVAWKKKRLASAGAWLACGMFKFHLVLLFLLLMLIQEKTAQGRKRILTGFLGVSVILVAVSVVAVGTQEIISYPHYVLGLEKTMAGGAINPSDMPNLRGFLYLIAGNHRYFDLLVISLSVVLVLVAAWVSDIPARGLPDDSTSDLKFCVAVFACVLVSYHALVHDLCVLALPVLLLVGQLGSKIRVSSWPGVAISAGLAGLLFSPLQLVLLMRYDRLAWLGLAVLLCFVGVGGELKSRGQRAWGQDFIRNEED